MEQKQTDSTESFKSILMEEEGDVIDLNEGEEVEVGAVGGVPLNPGIQLDLDVPTLLGTPSNAIRSRHPSDRSIVQESPGGPYILGSIMNGQKELQDALISLTSLVQSQFLNSNNDNNHNESGPGTSNQSPEGRTSTGERVHSPQVDGSGGLSRPSATTSGSPPDETTTTVGNSSGINES
jgi:hypothetical protein